jgi:hypothetical protein
MKEARDAVASVLENRFLSDLMKQLSDDRLPKR